jgi:hypothetical protein
MTRTLLMASAASVLVSAGWAEPFDPLVVHRDARFAAHVDLDAARKTDIGAMILERIRQSAEYQQLEDFLLQAAGFMPESDIRDITLYGFGFQPDPQAVVVLRANFDRERLVQALSFAQGFDSDVYNGQSLLTWIDDKSGNPVHASIVDDETILFAGMRNLLEQAVDAVTDSADALAGDSFLGVAGDPARWAMFAATDLKSAPGAAGNPVLSQLDNTRIEIVQRDQDTVATLSTTAVDAAQGEQLFNLANGLKALAIMNGMKSDPAPTDEEKLVAEIAGKAELSRKDQTVGVTLRMPSARVIELIETRLMVGQ